MSTFGGIFKGNNASIIVAGSILYSDLNTCTKIPCPLLEVFKREIIAEGSILYSDCTTNTLIHVKCLSTKSF